MKINLLPIALGSVLMACSSLASAKTATTTTLTGPAAGRPGETIVLHAVVVGRHIAYNGGNSAIGGDVTASFNGDIFASTPSTGLNTPIVTVDTGYCSPDYTCSFPIYRGDVTTVDFTFTLPNSFGPASFVAGYTGDNTAYSSTSGTLVVEVKNPDITPVINLILQD